MVTILVLHLNNQEVEQVLSMRDCIRAMEVAFKDFANGLAVNRPRSHSYIPLDDEKFYLFKSMDGGIPQFGVHALRISSDILYERMINGRLRREKIPSAPGGRWLGLVFLFDINTGMLLAIMQDGYLQRIRVGATSALAAKVLARPESKTIGLLGTGWQAGAQLMGLIQTHKITLIKVFSPNTSKRLSFVLEMSKLLGVEIREETNPEVVVKGSDIVVAATNSLEPVFDGNWLEPGMHVNSIQGRELDEITLARSGLIVVRSKEEPTHWVMGSRVPGEMRAAKHLDEIARKKTVELGPVLTGDVTGRSSEDQITLFTGGGTGGSAGLGIQFAAVATVIYKAALARGLGSNLLDDLFLETVHP